MGWLILGGVAYYLYNVFGGGGGHGAGAKQEISFQEFRNQLLAKVCARLCVCACVCVRVFVCVCLSVWVWVGVYL